MREIKLRAWSKRHNKWVSPMTSFSFVTADLTTEFKDTEEIAYSQYTGLKDKNDKEIYEGDILSWGNNVIAKVYWADNLAMFRCVIEGTEEFDLFAFNQEASIIGNIHESKELLDE